MRPIKIGFWDTEKFDEHPEIEAVRERPAGQAMSENFFQLMMCGSSSKRG